VCSLFIQAGPISCSDVTPAIKVQNFATLAPSPVRPLGAAHWTALCISALLLKLLSNACARCHRRTNGTPEATFASLQCATSTSCTRTRTAALRGDPHTVVWGSELANLRAPTLKEGLGFLGLAVHAWCISRTVPQCDGTRDESAHRGDAASGFIQHLQHNRQI